jgi:hypothetical protein
MMKRDAELPEKDRPGLLLDSLEPLLSLLG